MQRFILGLGGFTTALLLPVSAWAQKVVPGPSHISSAPTYTLTTGGTTLQVSTANSARINSLNYQGLELLYLNSSGGNVLWGSTFWASPQAHWTAACKSANNLECWPPPAALDGNAYTGGIVAADTSLSYTGAAESYTKLRFRKTFTAEIKDSSFTNTYHMVNTSASPITWAPWEDTRFPSGGITFWPTGTGAPTGNANLLKQVRDSLGVTWFTYDSSAALSGTTKIFADAGTPGWMAHVDKNRVLFIKKFADTPPAKKAPGVENECEIYVTRALLEMELQGPYDAIPGNDSAAWQVKWYVRKLPEGIAISRNHALADFTARVASGGSTQVRSRSAGVTSDFRSGIFGETIRLHASRPMQMRVSLADVSGKTDLVLSEGYFDAGWHEFRAPAAMSSGPVWLVARAVGSGALLYRNQLFNLGF